MFEKQCEGFKLMPMGLLNAENESISKKERKVCGRTARGKYTKQSVALFKKVEEYLIAENQRLCAEVDYLKNLQALVLEEDRRQHRKCR